MSEETPVRAWFKPTTRIGACCAKETSRYAIAGVQVRKSELAGEVWLSATDGRSLAVTPAKGETDVPHIAPQEVLPRKMDKRNTVPTVLLNGDWKHLGSDKSGLEIDGNFPPCADVIPDVKSARHVEGAVITLDVDLLRNIAMALREYGERPIVTLLVPNDPTKPIAVLGGDGLGVLMPVSGPKKPDALTSFETRANAYRACGKVQHTLTEPAAA